MQDNSFNRDIEQKLEGFLIDPSEKVWDAVEKELDRKKRRYFFMWYWLLPALILSTGLVWMLTKKEDQKKQTPTATIENKKLPAINEEQLKTAILDSQMQVQKRVATTNATGNLVETDSVYASNKIKWNQKSRLSATIKNAVAVSEGEPDNGNNAVSTPDKAKADAILPVSELEETEQKISGIKIDPGQTLPIENSMDSAKEASKDTAFVITKADSASIISTNVDSTQTIVSKKENNKKSSKWQKEWNLEAGFSNLGTVGVKNKNIELQYNGGIGSNPGSAAQVITSNQYNFTNGAYFTAGLNISKKLSKKIQWTTGLHYNFQMISLKRIYRVDTLINIGAPQYTNVINQSFKENLQIHSINIPLLLKFSLTKKFEINTGIDNRLQLSSNWKKYENVLGKEQAYLPLFYLNPSYSLKNFSVGPVASIGLIQYKNGTRMLNFGLSLKYFPEK